MASYRRRSDIIIEGLDEHPIAIVEVQSWRGLSRDEAIEIRGSILSRGVPANIHYFLLLTQDIGFLWRSPEGVSPDASPTYEFPMDSVVRRFSNASPDERLFQSVLELVYLSWLTNLRTKSQSIIEEPEKTLALAGFIEAIKNAVIFIRDYV